MVGHLKTTIIVIIAFILGIVVVGYYTPDASRDGYIVISIATYAGYGFLFSIVQLMMYWLTSGNSKWFLEVSLLGALGFAAFFGGLFLGSFLF